MGTLINTEGFVVLNRNSGATAADAGWALLGNPYPAPLNYALVDPSDRPGLDAAIYVYQSTGQYVGQYRPYANGIGGNPVLPRRSGLLRPRQRWPDQRPTVFPQQPAPDLA